MWNPVTSRVKSVEIISNNSFQFAASKKVTTLPLFYYSWKLICEMDIIFALCIFAFYDWRFEKNLLHLVNLTAWELSEICWNVSFMWVFVGLKCVCGNFESNSMPCRMWMNCVKLLYGHKPYVNCSFLNLGKNVKVKFDGHS